MSRSLQAFMAPLPLVRALIGCKMTDVFEMHARGIKKLLKQLDEEIEENGADFQPIDPNVLAELRSLPTGPDPEFDDLEAKLQEIKARRFAGEDVTAELDAFVDQAAAVINSDERTGFTPNLQDAEDDEPLPTAMDCLRHLFFGTDLDPRVGYAYDFLCEQLLRRNGQKLPSSNWTEIKRLEYWLATLDTKLIEQGVTPFAKNLANRGNPLLFGAESSMGYFEAEEVATLAAMLKGIQFENQGFEEPGLYLADIRKWLMAASKEEWGLVCFIN